VHQYLPPVGPMTSRMSLASRGDWLSLSLENVSSLNYGILPVINAGNFFAELRVYLGDDFTLIYGVGGVRFFNPFNIFGDKIDPFFYRFQGIFDHYTEFMRPVLEEG